METFEAPERPETPTFGDERTQLEAWLDFQRTTLLRKCDGLRPEQMKIRPVSTSKLSLLGIIRHMTFVEQIWYQTVFDGRDVAEYYKTESDRDADFNDLESTSAEEVIDLYLYACQLSRDIASGRSLDDLTAQERRGRHFDLRWIYLHMIEEYARHNGHADLIRELIDGTTGY